MTLLMLIQDLIVRCLVLIAIFNVAWGCEFVLTLPLSGLSRVFGKYALFISSCRAAFWSLHSLILC
jgi:hypothetical protein